MCVWEGLPGDWRLEEGRCLGCVATRARTCWFGLPQLDRVGFGLLGFGGEIFRVDWWNGKAIVAGLPGLVWAA